MLGWGCIKSGILLPHVYSSVLASLLSVMNVNNCTLIRQSYEGVGVACVCVCVMAAAGVGPVGFVPCSALSSS